jgi:hypothetical protein
LTCVSLSRTPEVLSPRHAAPALAGGTPGDRAIFGALLETILSTEEEDSGGGDAGNPSLRCQPNGGREEPGDGGDLADRRPATHPVTDAEDADASGGALLRRKKPRDDARITAPGPGPASGGTRPDGSGGALLELFRREVERLVRVLRSPIATRKRGVSLTLDLGEIGEVRFDVQVSGIDVSIVATSGNPAAERLLATGLGALESLLSEAGLSLLRLDFRLLEGPAPPTG